MNQNYTIVIIECKPQEIRHTNSLGCMIYCIKQKSQSKGLVMIPSVFRANYVHAA